MLIRTLAPGVKSLVICVGLLLNWYINVWNALVATVQRPYHCISRSLDFDDLAVSVLESLPDFGQQLLAFIVELVALLKRHFVRIKPVDDPSTRSIRRLISGSFGILRAPPTRGQ